MPLTGVIPYGVGKWKCTLRISLITKQFTNTPSLVFSDILWRGGAICSVIPWLSVEKFLKINFFLFTIMFLFRRQNTGNWKSIKKNLSEQGLHKIISFCFFVLKVFFVLKYPRNVKLQWSPPSQRNGVLVQNFPTLAPFLWGPFEILQ